MGTLTERVRVFYLILLILFLLTVGFFLFDYYGLIEADELIPALAKKPSSINWDQESPTEVEKLEIEKSREKLTEVMSEIERQKSELNQDKEKLEAEHLRLEELKKGIQEKERELEVRKKEEANKENKLKVLASKVASMPPKKAVEMLSNWPDQDIIEVMKQMDKDAEADGRPTITNYLLTLFEEKRRSVIANKWLDSEQDKTPEENINTLLEKEVIP
ncbi:MAG: flagellar protein FlbB [Leptospiraceae bacterium]|nr:flagellar protein FlbB [Leptospiraceae bacterium]